MLPHRAQLLLLFRFQSTNRNQSGNTQQQEKTKKHGFYNSSVSLTLNVKLNGLSVFLLLFCPLYIHEIHTFYTCLRVDCCAVCFLTTQWILYRSSRLSASYSFRAKYFCLYLMIFSSFINCYYYFVGFIPLLCVYPSMLRFNFTS